MFFQELKAVQPVQVWGLVRVEKVQKQGHPTKDPAHHVKGLGLGSESFGKPLQELKKTSR